MKKYLILFLILLCTTGYANISFNENVDNVLRETATTNDSEQNITGVKNFVATPTLNNSRIATREYVDQTAATIEEAVRASNLRLYYVTATDSVTGSRLLASYPSVVATSIVYPALSSTVYVQVNTGGRLSCVNCPNITTLPAGPIESIRYMSSDQAISTNRSVDGINELWMVDVDGVSNPTFIASSSSYIVLGTLVQRIACTYYLPAEVSTGGVTRRFLEKHYRKRSGVLTGANPIVTVYYGGLYESLFSITLPSSVNMRTDGSNSADTVLFKNVKGAFIASDSSAGITNVITIGTQVLTFKDGILTNYSE